MLHGEVGYCAPEALCVSSAGVSIMVLSTEIYILPVLTRNPVQRPLPFSSSSLFTCHLEEKSVFRLSYCPCCFSPHY